MPAACMRQKLDKEQVEAKLRALTEEISQDLSGLDSAQSKALLSDFVSALFLACAERERREERRRRQAEGIAAAKKRGVRFGRPYVKPPGDFSAIVAEWEAGRLDFRQALERSGLAQATFYRRLKEYRMVKDAKK